MIFKYRKEIESTALSVDNFKLCLQFVKALSQPVDLKYAIEEQLKSTKQGQRKQKKLVVRDTQKAGMVKDKEIDLHLTSIEACKRCMNQKFLEHLEQAC